MAFVTAPWQLFALRALLGVFAGYGALTMSMAAQSVPRDKMAQAIGTVQTGHRLGPAIGPVIGGLLAPIVGLRNVVSGRRGVLRRRDAADHRRSTRSRSSGGAPRKVRGGWEVFSQLFRLPGFLLALFVIFGLQTVDRSFGPVLPLFVAQVGVRRRAHPDRGRHAVFARRDLGGVRLATRAAVAASGAPPKSVIVAGDAASRAGRAGGDRDRARRLCSSARP